MFWGGIGAHVPVAALRYPSPLLAVIDALEYAAYAHDVRHVVLDNLQFMMSSGASCWD